jgi:hypothetical protein
MLQARLQSAGLGERLTLVCDNTVTPLQMDQSACHLAVDSLLLAVLEAEPEARTDLHVHTVTIDRHDADELQVEPGRYVRIALSGLPEAVVAGKSALPTWDGSAAQLALLLARAAAREVGGEQRVIGDGTVFTYLPVGGRP